MKGDVDWLTGRRFSDVAYRAKLYYEARARREAAEKDIQKNKQFFNKSPSLETKLYARLKEMTEHERIAFDSYASKAALNEEIMTKMYGARNFADRALLTDYERASQARLDEQLKYTINKKMEEMEIVMQKKYEKMFDAKLENLESEMAAQMNKRLDLMMKERQEQEIAESKELQSKRRKISPPPRDETNGFEDSRAMIQSVHGKLHQIDYALANMSALTDLVTEVKMTLSRCEETVKRHDTAFRNLRSYMEDQKEFMDSMCRTLSITVNGEAVGDIDDETPIYSIVLPQETERQLVTAATKTIAASSASTSTTPETVIKVVQPFLEQTVHKKVNEIVASFNVLSSSQRQMLIDLQHLRDVSATSTRTLQTQESFIKHATGQTSAVTQLIDDFKALKNDWTTVRPLIGRAVEYVNKQNAARSAAQRKLLQQGEPPEATASIAPFQVDLQPAMSSTSVFDQKTEKN